MINLPPIQTDPSKSLDKWHVYPEECPNQRFSGFQNREDQSVLRGAFVVGQNVTFGGSTLPALRRGYEVIGTEASDSTPVRKAHVFENSSGSQFELKVAGTSLLYWLIGTSTSWGTLKSGLDATLDWGFWNIGRTTDNETHVIFSDGKNGVFKFNGANTTFDSAAATTGSIKTATATKNGAVTTVTLGAAGSGYQANDVVTLDGGDNNAQIRIDTVNANGAVATITLLGSTGSGYSVNTYYGLGGHGGLGQGYLYNTMSVNVTAVSASGGAGYTVGDILTVNAGNTDAKITVTSTNNGAVTGFYVSHPGSGYSVAAGVGVTGGTGAGFTLDVTAVGSNWIKKSGTTTWAEDGFYSSADQSVVINGTVYAYTSAGDSLYLVGVTPNPTLAGHAVGSSILQSVASVPGMTDVQGNVGIANDSRLHLRLEKKRSIWNSSYLGDPFNFVTIPAGTDGTGKSKFVEFGGPITAFGKLNKTTLCFKKRQIKLLDFVTSGNRVDVDRYQTLVSADDKGTTLGAINQKSTFSTPLGMVFVTPDKRLVLLTGVTANNEPQYLFLSDPIQPVFTDGVFDEASGICVDNVIYLAFKQDSNSTYNDTVLRGDMTRQSIDSMGRILPIRWDAPFVGWNVNDWTVVYNETTGQNEIHWHSSLNSSTYRLINQKSDNGTGYTGIIRTWAENFENPTLQKKIDEYFIEIRMNENASVTATLLYDEDGYTGKQETVLSGTEAVYKFGGTVYNPFGATRFGSEKFGSNIETGSSPVYRYHIELNPNIYFYTVSLQLSTDGDGQDFELVRFGYHLIEINKDTDRKYLKA